MYNGAMEMFANWRDAESVKLFQKAAAKGHEESSWIVRVIQDAERENMEWKEAFAQSEKPWGWYFAGYLSSGQERFDFCKKSAEGGCSWGQVEYGTYFDSGEDFVEQDEKVYMEWIEKAEKQNNPFAMELLGFRFRGEKKALAYHRAAAELGSHGAAQHLANLFESGEGGVLDSREAIRWYSLTDSFGFWLLLEKEACDLEGDFNQLCYMLGWGLYWYRYESKDWRRVCAADQEFATRCLDYYCSCVEVQQKSVVEFLLFWNQSVGTKDVGVVIGKMVWEGREDNLLKEFGMGALTIFKK
jgi:hypothetical protein